MMPLMRHHGVRVLGVVLVALTRRRRGAVVDVASRRRATARATTARASRRAGANRYLRVSVTCGAATWRVTCRVVARVTRRGACGANAICYHITLRCIIYYIVSHVM